MLAVERPVKHGGDELYDDNSGTSLCVQGKDFCIVAADTRHSAAYTINTRKATKIFVIDGRFLLTVTGFYADGRSVMKQLTIYVEDYQFRFNKKIGIVQTAALLHTILYKNRFFPKYAYCCLVGYTEEGESKIYSYDPVGSYQETNCRCNGSGTKLIQPKLDSWISRKNWNCEEGKHDIPSQEETIALVRDIFSSAAETDVKTGDALELYIFTKDGITRTEYPLRGD
ncbi:20S proteasome subunit beta 6 [Nematocida sp. AWRm80]|nr:20S proteasome subunit beta 6 [Nematocida sp. AWRm80]